MPVPLPAGFAISSAGNLLTGLGIAAMDVAANTLIQRTVPPALLSRVFDSLYGAIGVAAALSYLAGSLLLDLTDPPTTFLVAGTASLAVTLATALPLLRRTDF
jgi:MFS family permease